MDPLTAALNLAREIAHIWALHLEALPIDKRAEMAAQFHEDTKWLRDLIEFFRPKEKEK